MPRIQAEVPSAFDLIRHIPRKHELFWRGSELLDMPSAPVYLFPNAVTFDADTVESLAKSRMALPLNLPHASVIFEVTLTGGAVSSAIAYATQRDATVTAFLFHYNLQYRKWTDTLARAEFLDGGTADVEMNPRASSADVHGPVLSGIVWRACALLATEGSASVGLQVIPHDRRLKLARLRKPLGWTYRVVDIDLAEVRARTPAQGGTHASPRWHIRRGHWRRTPTGGRTFVHEHEVGSVEGGGVVKDYRVVAA